MTAEWMVLRGWSLRRWVVAAVGAAGIVLVVAIPTAIVPNSFFTRSMPVTWWSYPVLVLTGVAGGLLLASYMRDGQPPVDAPQKVDRPSRMGLAGTTLAFFAVGCPVCNKVVLIALGASGAMTWFAPLQPLLAAASLVLLAVALRVRLRNQASCALRPDRVIAVEN